MGVLGVQTFLDDKSPWLDSELYSVALFLGTVPSVLVLEAGED